MLEMGDVIDMRPYEVARIACRLGEGYSSDMGNSRLSEILQRVRTSPATPIRLRVNTDTHFAFQNPGAGEDTPDHRLVNMKRDLDILQRMGLMPGSTRPAVDIFRRLFERIPSLEKIFGCVPGGAGVWAVSTDMKAEHYARAVERGLDIVIPKRTEQDKAEAKDRSLRDIRGAGVLHIRPHHLMCMACFDGARGDAGHVLEDNLYELTDLMRSNPGIRVRLARGCCMVCTPCPWFVPESRVCIDHDSMALRDEKKDLDILQTLGLDYGDTMPANELLRLLFRKIRSTTQICGYGNGGVTSPEWSVCGGKSGNESFLKARAAGLGVPGAQPD